tara:strand:+ start:335 stop:1129 length:795 start_codon:yes stop_codon:yes gene_type:complete
MAYQAGGTDYGTFLRQRAQADQSLTSALKAKGERDRAARVKKSGQRSGLAKLGSAVVRGAAAYYTGGMSEQMGAGSMIDEAMLGTDSEGRAVRNEYGELAGMASQIGQGMSAKKAGEAALKLKNQSARDDAMQTRLDNLDPELGMEFALKREKKDAANLAALQEHKGGYYGLMNKDVEGLDFEATKTGDWQSKLTPKTPDATKTDYTRQEGKGGYQSAIPEQTITTRAEPKEGSVALSTKDALEAKRKRDAELKAMGPHIDQPY